MLEFLSGMTTMGFLVAGLFFFRFWARTRDAIFVYFSVSFCLLAISQALGTLAEIPRDARTWIYLLRLAAFTLLIVGIVAKNFGQATRKAGGG
ncbi:MAG: hypothetical protein GEU95_18950 [Rhizobiales bacterium]|nr:hypothetical protein [Hyphomicrobiales bacterium]